MRKFYFLVILFLNSILISSQITEETKDLFVDYSKTTVKTRFSPPKGFVWQTTEKGSFEDFLVNFPLYPENFPVRDYKNIPLLKQNFHAAILKIDVGNKNLQQCADAWIRLYAEYLWMQKRFNEIGFELTSEQFFSWNEYEKGWRTVETGDTVKFVKSAKADSSYKNFRNYLDVIFQYAGTISLDRESVSVIKNEDIEIGDFIIKPGSPGHLVFIIGIAKNEKGKKLYLLAESYMPAQEIHILKNPLNKTLSPWYELNVNAPRTVTAKYIFAPTNIKRYSKTKSHL